MIEVSHWVPIGESDDIKRVRCELRIQRDVLSSSTSGWLIYVLKKAMTFTCSNNAASKEFSGAETVISAIQIGLHLSHPTTRIPNSRHQSFDKGKLIGQVWKKMTGHVKLLNHLNGKGWVRKIGDL